MPQVKDKSKDKEFNALTKKQWPKIFLDYGETKKALYW